MFSKNTAYYKKGKIGMNAHFFRDVLFFRPQKCRSRNKLLVFVLTL